MPGLQAFLGCEAECHCLGRRHCGPATSLISTWGGGVGAVRQKDEALSLKLPPVAAVSVTLHDPEGTTRSARSGGQGWPAMPDLEEGGARDCLTQPLPALAPRCA